MTNTISESTVLLRIVWDNNKSCCCYIPNIFESNYLNKGEFLFDFIIYDKNCGGFISSLYKCIYYDHIMEIIERNQQTNLHNQLPIDFNSIDTIAII